MDFAHFVRDVCPSRLCGIAPVEQQVGCFLLALLAIF